MADNYSGYANAGGWAGAGEGITQAATMLLGNNMETYRQEKLLKLRGDQAKGLQAERIAAEEGLLGTKLASQEGEGQLDRESAERIAAMRADSAKASKGWDAVPFTDADGNTIQRLYNKDQGVWKDEGSQPNMSIEQATTFAEKEAEAMDKWYKGDESIYGEGNTRESWTTNRILQLTGQKEGQAAPTDYSNLWGDAPAEKKPKAETDDTTPKIEAEAEEDGLINLPKKGSTYDGNKALSERKASRENERERMKLSQESMVKRIEDKDPSLTVEEIQKFLDEDFSGWDLNNKARGVARKYMSELRSKKK